MKKSRIDHLGRIVIPIQYRKELGLTSDTEIKFECENGRVIISSARERCCVCRKETKLNSKFPICENCIELIRKTE